MTSKSDHCVHLAIFKIYLWPFLVSYSDVLATSGVILAPIIKRSLSTSYMLGSNELHLFINNSLSDLKSADVWSTCLVVHRASALMG